MSIFPSLYTQASISNLMQKIIPIEVLIALGIDESNIVQGETRLTTTCPICGTDNSLVVETDSHNVYCQNLQCRVSKLNFGGGNLVEFLALATNNDYNELLREWAHKTHIILEDRSAYIENNKYLEEYVLVEVGRYSWVKTDEGFDKEPAPISFNNINTTGRGIYIYLNKLREYFERYQRDIYRGRFYYSTKDANELMGPTRPLHLPIIANYFIVFQAASSAQVVHAINQALDVIEKLRKDMGVPDAAMHIYYSGRLIEIEIDRTIFDITPNPSLNRIFRRMTELLLELPKDDREEYKKNYSQLDWTVYDLDNMTPIECASLATPKGVHKIHLNYSVFKRTNYVNLYELSKREPTWRDPEYYPDIIAAAKALYNQASDEIEGGDTQNSGVNTFREVMLQSVADHEAVSLHAIAPDLLKRLFDVDRRVLPTSHKHLNLALNGGLSPGNLYVATGFPGTGTTSFVYWLTNQIVQEQQVPLVYITLERGIEDLYLKGLSALGNIPSSLLMQKRLDPKSLYEDEAFNQQMFSAYEKYQQFSHLITLTEGHFIKDINMLFQMVERKRERIQRTLRQSSLMLVIDGLGGLLTNMRLANMPQLTLGGLVSQLKRLAREQDIIVIATHELFMAPERFDETELLARQHVIETYAEAPFADVLMVLIHTGHSTKALQTLLRSRFSTSSQKGAIEKIISNLESIEHKLIESGVSLRQSNLLSVELLKNTGGLLTTCLFMLHGLMNKFEPIDYLNVDQNPSVI